MTTKIITIATIAATIIGTLPDDSPLPPEAAEMRITTNSQIHSVVILTGSIISHYCDCHWLRPISHRTI